MVKLNRSVPVITSNEFNKRNTTIIGQRLDWIKTKIQLHAIYKKRTFKYKDIVLAN